MRAPDRRPQTGGARAGAVPAARTTAPSVAEEHHRHGAGCGHTAPSAAQGSPLEDVLRRPGRSLEDSVRADMESRLGAAFSDVRVPTDGAAHESAASVNAHAYTSGAHLVFQRGRYDGSSAAGRHMLAHELTHVIQQRIEAYDALTDQRPEQRLRLLGEIADLLHQHRDRAQLQPIQQAVEGEMQRQSARLPRLRRTTADEDGPYELMTEEGLLWNSPEFEHSTGALGRTGPGCVAGLSQRNLASMRSESRDRGHGPDIAPVLTERAVMEIARFDQSNPKLADSLKGMSGEALMNYLLKHLLRPRAMLPNAAQIAEENISYHVST
ncbi:DUF4157 domain-containing protein [Streptomyces caniferus]|uniref:eCIS core domain-containing protein n=1 Tax=Streptomyces caniferus TaxID=285557 RepID=UPI0034526685